MLSLISHQCTRKLDQACRRSPLMMYSCLHRNAHAQHPLVSRFPSRGLRIRRSNASTHTGEQPRLSTTPSSLSGSTGSTTASTAIEEELLEATHLREFSQRDWFFRRSNLSLLLFRVIAAGGLLHVLQEYVFEVTICEGPSMSPTLYPQGEIILVDKLTPRIYGIQGGTTAEERTKLALALQEEHDRGSDQSVWHQPHIPIDKLPRQGAWQRFFQRFFTSVTVGDVVVVRHLFRQGTVCKRVLGLPGDTVNNPPQDVRRSPAWRSRCQGNTLLVIPDGHMWIEGDNSLNSVDSRNYGPVPVNLLVGRVVARIWPLRGRAIMESGAPPSNVDRGTKVATTIFPAGYQGQEIVKDVNGLALSR